MTIKPNNAELPPIKVAFIIDNEVVEVLYTDDRLGAIFLSNPTIIDVTDKFTGTTDPALIGKIYNKEENTFSPKE